METFEEIVRDFVEKGEAELSAKDGDMKIYRVKDLADKLPEIERRMKENSDES